MKKLRGFLLFLCTALLCCGCGGKSLQRYSFVDVVMGTVLEQNIYAADEDAAAALTAGIVGLLEELERRELSWRQEGSELSAANQSAGSGEGFLLSEELTELLIKCREISNESEGALDVTLLPVVQLWDIDAWAAADHAAGFVPPDGETLERTLALCGSGKLKLEPEVFGNDGEVLRARLFMPRGMRLDLGAVGKGLALKKIKEFLEENGAEASLISLGGSILTYGEKPDGSPWKVGVADPRDTSRQIALLSLEGQWCVSTSGDYERYVEAGGVRYHHIMDPATGKPADSGVRSVTVLAKDGFLSDALSTACFILGVEKGMDLAGRCGAETLFVTDDGSVILSEGMKNFSITY